MARIFTLEALPALKGDCLILHYGDTDAPGLCVVDGGPGTVYANSLRPRLIRIGAARNLDLGETLRIDLLMVSHVDDDHIHGVLDLATELRDSRGKFRPPARVETVWHNSFDEIIGNAPLQLESAETAALAGIGTTDIPANADPDAAMVLASIGQGHDLRSLAKVLEWEVNPPFDALVMNSGRDAPVIDRFGGGLEITVISPQKAQLQKLQKEYDDYLKKKGLERTTPQAALAAISKDRSVANLSSIVVLMELDDRRILLTGDARGDHILEGLAARGLATEEDPLQLDILKLQHHGSNRNVSPEFFRRIKARHYVFSGNGEHGNPERQTLEWLFAAHGGERITLHFTYDIVTIDAAREAEALKHRQLWDRNADSIAALLTAEEQRGRNFDISQLGGKTGIRIDLLSKLED